MTRATLVLNAGSSSIKFSLFAETPDPGDRPLAQGALVFTAGIGERSAAVRSEVCKRLAWLGVVVDEAANNSHSARISARESTIGIWIIPTNEELMIARHSRAVLAQNDQRPGPP